MKTLRRERVITLHDYEYVFEVIDASVKYNVKNTYINIGWWLYINIYWYRTCFETYFTTVNQIELVTSCIKL